MNPHGALAVLGLVLYAIVVVVTGKRDGFRAPWLAAAVLALPVAGVGGGVGVGLALGHGGVSTFGTELGTLAGAATLLAAALVGLRRRALALADDVGLALLAGVAVARLGCVVVGDLVLPSGFDPAPVYTIPVLVGAAGAAVRWRRAAYGELAGVAAALYGVTSAAEGALTGSLSRLVAAGALLLVGAAFVLVARNQGAGRG